MVEEKLLLSDTLEVIYHDNRTSELVSQEKSWKLITQITYYLFNIFKHM
jgi:hypothetical protein